MKTGFWIIVSVVERWMEMILGNSDTNNIDSIQYTNTIADRNPDSKRSSGRKLEPKQATERELAAAKEIDYHLQDKWDKRNANKAFTPAGKHLENLAEQNDLLDAKTTSDGTKTYIHEATADRTSADKASAYKTTADRTSAGVRRLNDSAVLGNLSDAPAASISNSTNGSTSNCAQRVSNDKCSAKRENGDREGERSGRKFFKNIYDSKGDVLCMLLIQIYYGLYRYEIGNTITMKGSRAENYELFVKGCMELGVVANDCYSLDDFNRLRDSNAYDAQERVMITLLALQAAVTNKCQDLMAHDSFMLEHKKKASIVNCDEVKRKIATCQDIPMCRDVTKYSKAYAPRLDVKRSKSDGFESPMEEEYGIAIGARWKLMLDNYQSQLDHEHMKDSKNVAFKTYTMYTEIQEKIRKDPMLMNQSIDIHVQLWMLTSGAYTKMKENSGCFTELVQASRDLEIRNSDIVRQMNADIFRTVAEKDQTQHVENMKTVLLAYAEYNPKLGYCQGLNFIAEKLVRFTNQENAFWLLVQMIDQFPSDYYTTMFGIAVDQRVFSDLSSICNAQVNAHLQHLGGSGHEVSLVCTEWFLTLFASPFSESITIHVWDLLFALGGEVLFNAAIGLLQIHLPDVLRCNTHSDALCLLNRLGKSKLDVNQFVMLIIEQDFKQSSIIHELRSHYRLHLAAGLAVESSNVLVPMHPKHGAAKGHKIMSNHTKLESLHWNELPTVDMGMSSEIESSTNYAYFFDGKAPEMYEKYWTSYNEEDEALLWSNCRNRPRRSTSLDDNAESSESSTSMKWKQKIEEWQQAKKQAKQQRQLIKRRTQQMLESKKLRKKMGKHFQKSEPILEQETLVALKCQTIQEQQTMRSKVRRTISDPLLHHSGTLWDDMMSSNNSTMRERASIMSYLHRTALEAIMAADSASPSSLDSGSSFLGQLTSDLEQYLEEDSSVENFSNAKISNKNA